MIIKIALAQMSIAYGMPELNLANAEKYIQSAAASGCSIILLPECWHSGFDLEHRQVYAGLYADVVDRLQSLSSTLSISIGGSLIEEVSGEFFNTFTWVSPDEIVVKYQKAHLFRLMNEDRYLTPGSRLTKVDISGEKIGLAICYDLRFPEMFRTLALQGAKLFLVPAGWPLKRIAHWRTLLRARAIENQAFLAAVNYAGVSGQEIFGGSSAVISPWGDVLCEGNESDAVLLNAEIDLSEVGQVRSHIPIFQDRRPDLYGL